MAQKKEGKILGMQRETFRSMMGKYGVSIVMVVMIILIGIMEPRFLSATNLINVATQITINGMLAFGMCMAITTGGIDLTVGAQVALGAVILGMVYNYLPYMIMPLYTVIMKIDRSLIEAAQDLGCSSGQVFKSVILPLSLPGIISGFTMVFVPAISTFYISQKLGSPGTTLIGDVIESQFKTAYNPNLGAALSLGLMVIAFACVAIMNRFSPDDDEGGVVTL